MEYLKSIRFYTVESYKSIFTNRKIIMVIYVNGLIILGADLESIIDVKKLLKEQFKINNKRKIRVILDIQI